jgi:cytoskeletal protein CcmA (bactofilin family)
MFSKKTEAEIFNQRFSNQNLSPSHNSLIETSATTNFDASKSEGNGEMSPSILGEDLSITGNISSKGEIQIDGEVQGDIYCLSVIVGEKAHVSGGIAAEDVIVRGKVTGSIRGVRVTLQASSQVEGDIYHHSLAIEQGAYFEGKSRRSDDPLADLSKSNSSFESATKNGQIIDGSAQSLHSRSSNNSAATMTE